MKQKYPTNTVHVHGHNYWLQILSGSTKASDETVEFEGALTHLYWVESTDSHPFHWSPKFTQADGQWIASTKYGFTK